MWAAAACSGYSVRTDSEVGTLTPQKCGEGVSVLKAPCMLNFSLPLTLYFSAFSVKKGRCCGLAHRHLPGHGLRDRNGFAFSIWGHNAAHKS